MFARTLEAGGLRDRVVIALEQGDGTKIIPVSGVFPDGTTVKDWYSGVTAVVQGGSAVLTTAGGLVLLGESR